MQTHPIPEPHPRPQGLISPKVKVTAPEVR